jgi:DNA-binding CsgD family transcriptional regulator
VTLGIVQRIPAGGTPELAVSEDLVSEALRLGIVVPVSLTTCEMHPLMREFLLAMHAHDRDDLQTQSSTVFDVALRNGDWEMAAECVLLSRDPMLLERLLDHELNHMMTGGRLATLREWEKLASEVEYRGVMRYLLRAELAFCDGRYAQSALDAGVAVEIADNPERRVEALSRAGRAEYFADNNRGAIAAYSSALNEAVLAPARADALRGLVLASVALDEPDLASYWEQYLRHPPADAADVLRRAATELHVAYYRGRLHEALESASRAKDLLGEVRDPMIRSGFLNTVAHTLILAGRFREGEQAARACLSELREYGLEFGFIHINISLARAAAGLKRYTDAAALLRDTRAAHGSTPFTRVSCDAQLMRIMAIRGGARQPLPSSMPQIDVNLYAELVATHALYEAVRGDASHVSAICRQADELSHSEEVRVLTGWARAVGCLALGADVAATQARDAVRRSLKSGIVDSLVVAYRAAPQLLDLIRSSVDDDERDFLVRVMTEAGDDVLCEAHRLGRPGNDAPLTPRELEVLQLVAAGLTNQEIASQLFITLSTAKVHVRHIMEKLNARSRTEAAMKGLALGTTQTASETAGDTTVSPRRPSR